MGYRIRITKEEMDEVLRREKWELPIRLFQ